jgi:cysteine desulfurase
MIYIVFLLQNASKKHMTIKLPIYLDYNATTPTDPRVLKEIMPYFTEKYGNPHSSNHAFGWEAEEAVEIARESIANLIGARKSEIIFTSGATESNNLAIKGLANLFQDHPASNKKHMITAVTEHACVLQSCKYLEKKGFKITYLPVEETGLVNLDTLKQEITDETFLVSIMTVNNEIGTIQPISEIGQICRDNNVYFHTDAAQAFGKLEINVNDSNIDLLSISGHKIYATKGIGALYVRRKPKVRLQAIISGGGQEEGLRSGTVPVPLAVGLGKAAQIANHEITSDYARISKLSNLLLNAILEVDGTSLNGGRDNRIAGNLNIRFDGVDSSLLLSSLSDLAISSGSACASSSLEPSHVLNAIHNGEDSSGASLRFSIGKYTTEEEIACTIKIIKKNLEKLQNKNYSVAKDI